MLRSIVLWVRALGRGNAVEREMHTHSSTIAAIHAGRRLPHGRTTAVDGRSENAKLAIGRHDVRGMCNVACAIPATSASGVDPNVALRSE